jgi:hypothetical protein
MNATCGLRRPLTRWSLNSVGPPCRRGPFVASCSFVAEEFRANRHLFSGQLLGSPTQA